MTLADFLLSQEECGYEKKEGEREVLDIVQIFAMTLLAPKPPSRPVLSFVFVLHYQCQSWLPLVKLTYLALNNHIL